MTAVPRYDGGWRTDGRRQPFLSYVASDPSVNSSDGLEALHEEASRTHSLDRWTRGVAIVERAAGPDGGALPLADSCVEVVVSDNLLEHIPDDRGALREISRVPRPGARAAILAPAGQGTYDYHDRFPGPERRYARLELASRCAKAGLELLKDVRIAALLFPAFWLVKQRNRLRYGHMRGEALQTRVAVDIERTRDSGGRHIARRLESRLVQAISRLPFGIRSSVVARRSAAA